MTKKPMILVVDDEKEARSIVIDFLSQRYECYFKEANDGDEAVKFIESNPCDIMLLDVRMPKKNGIAVLKEAKEINPNIDILIVSGWVSDDVAEEAMKIGASDYVLKPLNLKALSLKFANLLEKRNQRINKI